MEDDQVVGAVVYGVITWAALFIVLRKSLGPKRSFDFCNRLVSTIHACLAVVLSCLSIQDWTCPACPFASKPSPTQMRSLVVTLSYMVYDILCGVFGNNLKIDNFFHHSVCIIGSIAGFLYQMGGSEMVAALCITEISTPFLHLREILKDLGYKDTSLNLAADICFAVVFTLGRMVAGPYLTYLTVTAHNPILMKAMALGLQLVSAFWFYKIARMLKYKLFVAPRNAHK
ncbi:TLC domain-containing protein 5-like [Impatiens glandulifera]|uniref:TLC domain-containing protein 5-like n=1 Tax=Impatiens glandulifera TaxID=253017 RepID=UPI001FB18912|nr:TLC domain-containing protein 5-like [Impatiens glandulifera]